MLDWNVWPTWLTNLGPSFWRIIINGSSVSAVASWWNKNMPAMSSVVKIWKKRAFFEQNMFYWFEMKIISGNIIVLIIQVRCSFFKFSIFCLLLEKRKKVNSKCFFHKCRKRDWHSKQVPAYHLRIDWLSDNMHKP